MAQKIIITRATMQRTDLRETLLFKLIEDEKPNMAAIKRTIESIRRSREQIKSEYTELKLEYKEENIFPSLNIKDTADKAPIDLAASKGHTEIVRLLLEEGSLSHQALLHAAVHKHSDCIRILLEAKANCNILNGNGLDTTPLHYCANNNDIESVRLLIEANANVNAQTSNNSDTPLMCAAAKGHSRIVSQLLAAGALPYSFVSKEEKCSALHLAARGGHLECVQTLIKNVFPASLDAQDANGCTPLHCAAALGHDRIVALLLEQGANSAIRDSDGNTPLSIAVLKKNPHCVKLLSVSSARITDRFGSEHMTPLILAARNGCTLSVSHLLAAGANPALGDRNGDTALHWSAYQGHAECVALLTSEAKNLNISNRSRRTPADEALQKSHYDCLAVLLSHGATAPTRIPRETPPDVCSALHRFCLGVLAEQENDLGSAIDCYTRSDYPAAHYRLSLIYRRTASGSTELQRSIMRLSDAVQGGYSPAVSNLLTWLPGTSVNDPTVRNVLKYLPETPVDSSITRIAYRMLSFISLSSKLTPSEWQLIALTVMAAYDGFDSALTAYQFACEAAFRAVECDASTLSAVDKRNQEASAELATAEIELERLQSRRTDDGALDREIKIATEKVRRAKQNSEDRKPQESVALEGRSFFQQTQSLFWRLRRCEEKNSTPERYESTICNLSAHHASRLIVDYAGTLDDKNEAKAAITERLLLTRRSSS